MSASCPSFQSLPVDVVKLLLDYVFYFDAGSFALAKNSSSPRSKRRSLAILHSCHIWRAAFIERFFNSLTLECSARSPLLLRFTNDPYFIDPLFYPTEQPVKSLVIDLRRWQPITSGDALRMLADAEQLGLTLTSVRSLEISVDNTRKPLRAFGDEPMDKMHHIVQFLTHLRRMAPNMRKVDLSFRSLDSLERNREANTLLYNAVDDFIGGATSVKLELPLARLNTEYKLDLPSGLVHFTCTTVTMGRMWHIEVARYNSDTLRELVICRPTRGQASSLIYDDSDCPVIYPLLHTLKIGKKHLGHVLPRLLNDPVPSAPSDEHIVHFPLLANLCLPCQYPFASNVMLKDKHATVERLSIVVSPETIHNVNTFRFIADSTVNLRDIIFEHDSSASTFAVRGELLSAISNILDLLQESSPRPKRFKLLAGAQWSDLVSSIPVIHLLSSITCLNIPYVSMIFADIVSLLRHAPNLISLTCKLSPNLPKHEGVHPKQMPSYVKEHVFPVGKYLKVLRDISDHIPNPLHAYKTAVLLAIACPNLAFIELPGVDSNIIKYGIDTSTNMGEYANYSRRLKSLFRIN